MFVLPSFEALVVTVTVTAIRTIIEASPTVLGGVVVAAWLRSQATPQRVQTIFREDGVRGALRVVLVGMALPVCSLGVLPVLRELRRLGLSTSKLITLALVAPLLNPIALLYAFTVLSGIQLLLISVVVVLLAIVIGDVSSRFDVRNAVTAEQPPAGLTGATRLRNHLVAATRIATGWLLIDLVIVVLVSGLVASFIPAGTFTDVCAVSNRGGAAAVPLLVFAQYVGPAHGIIQQVAVDKASLSLATGLVLYVFAVGLSAGNIWLLFRWFGPRRMAAVTVAMMLVVSATAFASGVVLPASVEETDETSGLDNLARPAMATFNHLGTTVSEALKFTDPLMMVGTLALVLLVPAGGIVRFAKIGYRIDDPADQSAVTGGRMAKAIPPSQLGAVAVCGIGILCCLTTYVFLPAPGECMEEMQTIRMDANIALRQGEVNEALQHINAWDSVAAKLPVGAAVHFSFPTPAQRQATRDLRMALHNTRTLLRDGDVKTASKQIPDLMRRLDQTKDAFRGGSS